MGSSDWVGGSDGLREREAVKQARDTSFICIVPGVGGCLTGGERVPRRSSNGWKSMWYGASFQVAAGPFRSFGNMRTWRSVQLAEPS